MLKSLKESKKLVYILISAILIVIYILSLIHIFSIKSIKTQYLMEDLSYYDEEQIYTTGGIDVQEGIYDINISYSSPEDVKVDVVTDYYCSRNLLSDNPSFSSNDTNGSFSIWTNNDCERIQLNVSSEADDYQIDYINIATSSKSKIYLISKLTFVFLILFTVLILFIKRVYVSKHFKTMLSISIITIVASLGLCNGYLLQGHDLSFHMLRIEGLAESLAYGRFPDKVQPNWFCGWGYAVSAMYGDMLFLPSAIMRLIGFPLMSCYDFYVVLINLGTAFTSYYAFKVISKDNKISALVCFLYTCSPYRLCCIYIRAAAGEYAAYMFFPLIILAFYYIYSDLDSENYGKQVLIPSLGFAFLLQTHILSCVMSSIFIIIYLILRYKETFKKKRLLYILKMAVSSLLLALWFLVPLLRFSFEPLEIFTDKPWNKEIQWYGASLTELVAQIPSSAVVYKFAYNVSLKETMPLAIGNGFALLFIFFLFYHKKINENKKEIIRVLSLAILAVFMASVYFPYNYMHRFLPVLADYIATIQYPYRFITISTVFFAVASVLILKNLKNTVTLGIYYLILAVIIIVAAHQSFSTLYNVIYSGSFVTHYDPAGIDTTVFSGYEYLYDENDKDVVKYDHEVIGYNAQITSCSNKYNDYNLKVESAGEGAFIELPLFYYPGYVAENSDYKEFEIERGTNNRIRILLPDSYNGDIHLSYRGLFVWRIAEVISVLSFAGIYYIQYKKKKPKKIESEQTEEVEVAE